MAWTDPKTIAVGDDLLASDWNTYIRDNLKYLHGDTGDTYLSGTLTLPNTLAFRSKNQAGTGNVNLIRANTADGVEIPLGASNHFRVLLPDGVTTRWMYDSAGDPSWHVPQALVHNSADINVVAADGNKVLLFDTEDFDTDSMHSTLVNTGRLTAPIDGYYLVTLQGRWESDGTPPIRIISIRLNGGDVLAIEQDYFRDAFTFATPVSLSAGDYVEAIAYTDDVGVIEANAKSSCYFGLLWTGGNL